MIQKNEWITKDKWMVDCWSVKMKIMNNDDEERLFDGACCDDDNDDEEEEGAK